MNTSMTQYPEIYVDKNDIAYCDCPGFGDTTGSGKDIINVISIKRLLENAKGIKILLALA
jgi:hypothetical protein